MENNNDDLIKQLYEVKNDVFRTVGGGTEISILLTNTIKRIEYLQSLLGDAPKKAFDRIEELERDLANSKAYATSLDNSLKIVNETNERLENEINDQIASRRVIEKERDEAREKLRVHVTVAEEKDKQIQEQIQEILKPKDVRWYIYEINSILGKYLNREQWSCAGDLEVNLQRLCREIEKRSLFPLKTIWCYKHKFDKEFIKKRHDEGATMRRVALDTSNGECEMQQCGEALKNESGIEDFLGMPKDISEEELKNIREKFSSFRKDEAFKDNPFSSSELERRHLWSAKYRKDNFSPDAMTARATTASPFPVKKNNYEIGFSDGVKALRDAIIKLDCKCNDCIEKLSSKLQQSYQW